MKLFSKRSLLALAAVGTLSVALVGCGKKEAPPAPAAAAPKAEPLKAAWVYVGPVGEAGWTLRMTWAARLLRPSTVTSSRPPLLKKCLKALTPSV